MTVRHEKAESGRIGKREHLMEENDKKVVIAAGKLLEKVDEGISVMYLLDTVRERASLLEVSPAGGRVAPGNTMGWKQGLEYMTQTWILPKDQGAVRDFLSPDNVRRLSAGERKEIIYQQVAGNWQKFILQALQREGNVTTLALGMLTDITESKRRLDQIAMQRVIETRRSEHYARLLFDAAADVYTEILKVDTRTGNLTRIKLRDGAVAELSGESKWAEKFVDMTARIHPEDLGGVLRKVRNGNLRRLPIGEKVRVTYRAKCQGSLYRWYSTTFCLVKNDAVLNIADPKEYATVFTMDINDEMIERARLKDLSEHDRLTDLFNRTKLDYMSSAEYRTLFSCGVLFFDINNLKETNDTKGHSAGDAIICQVADSIRSITNRRIHGYRLGGDEFVVVICNAKPKEPEQMIQLWKDRLEILSADSGIRCVVAVGMAWSRIPFSLSELIHQADQEMYRNKAKMKTNGED